MISIYVDIGHNPMFGGGHDILIANNAGQNSRSYTRFNETFSAPSPVKEKGYNVSWESQSPWSRGVPFNLYLK